jgi:hypothetical protein
MITSQTNCFNAIYDLLVRHDNSDVVDNDKNHDERQHAEAEVVDDNVNKQTTQQRMPCDEVDSNKNQDELHNPEAERVVDTMKQTTNTTMDDHLPDDLCIDNDQGTGWMKSPI